MITVDQILDRNLEAFGHMLSQVGLSYDTLMLGTAEWHFRHVVDYVLSDDFKTKEVLDGGGSPYQDEYAKHVLLSTALDVPMTVLDGIPSKERHDFYVTQRRDLIRNRGSSHWYTAPTFALRMRPMIEGSRKSLEGYWLERTVRESFARVAERLGLTVDPKNDRTRHVKNRTVITLRGHTSVIRAQVKGVNNTRHHSERAKILAKFANDVMEDGELPLPILVGDCEDSYSDIPALQYVRVNPSSVVGMGEALDELLTQMVCRLL